MAVIALLVSACDIDQEPEVLGSLFLGDGEVKTRAYTPVDLGLSVKWADCNVGALKSWHDGKFFAWGETMEKKDYSWDNYLYFSPEDISLQKYGLHDGLLYLQSEDDPATALMGAGWRLPTGDEYEELLDNCDWSITTQNGDKIVTATSRKNGASIDFYLTGLKNGDSSKESGTYGFLWSSERVEDTPSTAYILELDTKNNKVSIKTGDRFLGLNVRGVRK